MDYYSPIDRAREVEHQVTVAMNETNEQSRWYYRSWSTHEKISENETMNCKFRPTNYYGGSACADVIGCNIDCVYCWVKDENKRVNGGALLLSPQEVVDDLLKVADAKNYNIIRLSGGEPTLSRKHLMSIFKYLKEKNFTKKFILETNGILLGYDSSYVNDLRIYRDFLHVRVSLKGTTPKTFAINTGASPEFFGFQKKAILNCLENEIDCHAVVMFDRINTGEEIRQLVSSLREIGLTTPLEFERLFLYEHVVKRFEERDIPCEPSV